MKAIIVRMPTAMKIYLVKMFWKNLLDLGPEGLWIFVGQTGTAVAGLVGVKVLTNVLGRGEFGMLTLANTVVALISTNFLFGPLGQGLMRNWSISRDRGDLGAFYSVSNRYGLYAVWMGIAVSIGLVVVAMFIKGRDWAALMAISMATGVALGWLRLRISIFTAARQRQWVALLNIGNAVLKPVIAASLALLIALRASCAMAGYLLATLGVVFLAQCFYRRITSHTISSTLIPESAESGIRKDILSFSWPFVVWGIFNWIHMSCDRWALQTFHGAEVVGAFAVASQLATFPLILGSGFLITLFAPIAFQGAGNLSDREKIASANKLLVTMTGVYVMVAVILTTLFSLFHYPIVLLISNIQFAEFSFLLPWLTAAWGLFYLGQVLCNFGMLANRPQSYIMPKLVSAIVAGISTFYLSARIGPAGVVWGLAAAGLVYALWCFIIATKFINHSLIGIRIEEKPIVNVSTITH